MSAASHSPASVNTFSADELKALATTADALSAYLGQAVLAEVGVNEAGREWVVFGIPLDANGGTTAADSTAGGEDDNHAEPQNILHVQMGGPGTRVLGNCGGLDDLNETVYDCRFLWAIELRDPEEDGFRYVKLDDSGDEVDWTDDLPSLLPFSMAEEALGDPDDEPDDEDDDQDPPVHVHPAPPHRH